MEDEAIRGLSNFDLADKLVYAWCRNDSHLDELADMECLLAEALYESEARVIGEKRFALLEAMDGDERLAATLVEEWRRRHLGVQELKLEVAS